MYRIRFHGRGGQGMRTASRILGRALFNEGYYIQDAPRYGAERRGAPIFAYVRCSTNPINERGIILRPGLVVVADQSLLSIPAAGVLQGCTEHTVLLINSKTPDTSLLKQLGFKGIILTLPPLTTQKDDHFPSASCAGGAAALLRIINLPALMKAAQTELSNLPLETLQSNLDIIEETFTTLSKQPTAISPDGPVFVESHNPPDWITLPLEQGGPNIPAIIGSMTSHLMQTGSWRTKRPIIDRERCNRCWWICNTFCPDGAISLDEDRHPQINLNHCKGCLICMTQCPTHAITAIPEHSNKTNDKEKSV
ncbi:MAG: 2-oxoacid:acceptor oxidoreductase family protein [Desulfobulbaceae bacterium]|nr:2-oxoacid:acceptor oxidoreductase family protein [Desulfobulbaceae bacterium]